MSRRLVLLAALALVAMFAFVACGDDGAAGAPGAYTVKPAEAARMIDGGERTTIDVRTPAEFADAHVVGALNIDVDSADFESRIRELDPDEPYLVYCRSGNRSAVAADKMEDVGIMDIADAGGLADLARAGVPIE